jgi:hypothetical protein
VRRDCSGLAKRLGQPTAPGGGFLRFSGQVFLLQGFELFTNRSSGCVLNSLEDLVFLDTSRVLVGAGGLPPLGHIEV